MEYSKVSNNGLKRCEEQFENLRERLAKLTNLDQKLELIGINGLEDKLSTIDGLIAEIDKLIREISTQYLQNQDVFYKDYMEQSTKLIRKIDDFLVESKDFYYTVEAVYNSKNQLRNRINEACKRLNDIIGKGNEKIDAAEKEIAGLEEKPALPENSREVNPEQSSEIIPEDIAYALDTFVKLDFKLASSVLVTVDGEYRKNKEQEEASYNENLRKLNEEYIEKIKEGMEPLKSLHADLLAAITSLLNGGEVYYVLDEKDRLVDTRKEVEEVNEAAELPKVEEDNNEPPSQSDGLGIVPEEKSIQPMLEELPEPTPVAPVTPVDEESHHREGTPEGEKPIQPTLDESPESTPVVPVSPVDEESHHREGTPEGEIPGSNPEDLANPLGSFADFFPDGAYFEDVLNTDGNGKKRPEEDLEMPEEALKEDKEEGVGENPIENPVDETLNSKGAEGEVVVATHEAPRELLDKVPVEAVKAWLLTKITIINKEDQLASPVPQELPEQDAPTAKTYYLHAGEALDAEVTGPNGEIRIIEIDFNGEKTIKNSSGVELWKGSITLPSEVLDGAPVKKVSSADLTVPENELNTGEGTLRM